MSKSSSPSHTSLQPKSVQDMIGSPEVIVGLDNGGGFPGGTCGSQELEEGSDPLLLLLSVAQADGHPLPTGAYTARIVAEQVRTITGKSPVTVDVMNDR